MAKYGTAKGGQEPASILALGDDEKGTKQQYDISSLSGLIKSKFIDYIQKNSSLGSGYNIALSDLDIRGPGALFGYSQSGSSLVGFDLYTKLLNQAV